MKGRRVVMLCAGYHAKVVREALLLTGHEVVACLDDSPQFRGTVRHGMVVRGGMELLEDLVGSGEVDAAAIGTANVRYLDLRRRIYELALRAGVEMVNAIHPTASISPTAQLGAGLYLGPYAVVHTDCTIGNNVCIYTGSTVDHDNVLDDHVFISPGVHAAGMVKIGTGAYIGPGAILGNKVSIGAGTVVGAGSVVLSDLPDHVRAFGTPAQVHTPKGDRK